LNDPTPPIDPAASPPPEPAGVPETQPPPSTTKPELGQNSTLFALLSYASMFLGFPIFILPLAQRDDEFSLYHARQAGAVYILWLILFAVVFILSFVTCGFGAMLVPLVFLAYVPAIHGMILAAQGEMREPVMLFGLGDRIFGGITVKPKE